jgi:hypothetical protein
MAMRNWSVIAEQMGALAGSDRLSALAIQIAASQRPYLASGKLSLPRSG